MYLTLHFTLFASTCRYIDLSELVLITPQNWSRHILHIWNVLVLKRVKVMMAFQTLIHVNINLLFKVLCIKVIQPNPSFFKHFNLCLNYLCLFPKS